MNISFLSDFFPFMLGVIFVAVNGLTQLAFAQGLGFRMKPTGLAFMVAAALSLFWGSVTPVSGQSAMIALAGRTEEERQRVSALLISAVVMTFLGLFGVVSAVINFAGAAVMAGMMAGVGLMLSQVGADFITDEQRGNVETGVVSLVSAMLIFGFFNGRSAHVLVYVVAGSVGISTFYHILMIKVRGDALELPEASETDNYKFWTREYWSGGDWRLVKPMITPKSLLNAAALTSLGIGVTTSFGVINQNMSGIEQDFDRLTFITGFVDFISVSFGGMPLEAIISGTAAAPWPILGAGVLMIVLGLLSLLGLVSKICKYIPIPAIAGFLVVIGFFSTFLPNVRGGAFSEDIPAAATAMGVTTITKNPFLGMLAGIIVRYLGVFFGI